MAVGSVHNQQELDEPVGIDTAATGPRLAARRLLSCPTRSAMPESGQAKADQSLDQVIAAITCHMAKKCKKLYNFPRHQLQYMDVHDVHGNIAVNIQL